MESGHFLTAREISNLKKLSAFPIMLLVKAIDAPAKI
jgi:hypothetical protein